MWTLYPGVAVFKPILPACTSAVITVPPTPTSKVSWTVANPTNVEFPVALKSPPTSRVEVGIVVPIPVSYTHLRAHET